ncbi:MAG: hypothetical protein IJM59_09725 [Proteobacteria bacterium]|nr:hypothetical protein [Pseudomonadota bacterium]
MSIRKLSLVFACIGLAACSFGCDDEVGNLLSCTPGQTMCDGNSLKGCIGVTWSSIDCPQGCEETANGAQCKVPEGAECVVDKCKDSTTLNKCGNDFKVTAQPCGADQECVFNACVAKENGDTCEVGAVKCSADNSGVIKCGADGKWGATEACPSGQSCDAATNACAENAKVCEAGEKKCEGNVAMVCNDNKWDQEDCGNDRECKDGVCEVKQAGCDKSVESCAAEDKDFDVAKCECVEKAAACDKSAEICAADNGKAFDSELCQCVEKKDNCEDVPNSTLNGDGVCVCNDGYEKNADGQCVEKAAACDKSVESCAAEDKDFDEAKCECVEKAACDKSAEICAADNGKAFDSELCECVAPKENCEDVPNSTLKDGVCVCNEGFEKDDKGQCAEKAAACDKSAEICAKDGKDFDEAKCECVEKSGECTKKEEDCNKDNKNMKLDAAKCECVCGLTKCEDGKELDEAKCECVAKAECKYDANKDKNEKMCKTAGSYTQAGTYVVCTEKGTWDTKTTNCGNQKPVCDDSASKTDVCTGRCGLNDPDRCSADGVRQSCNVLTGAYEDRPCADGETCNNGKCECKPGEKRCAAGLLGQPDRLYTCGNDKQWKESNCSDNQYCDSEAKACMDKCKNNARKCSDDGTYMICNNGRWANLSACGGKDKCKQESGCDCSTANGGESKCDGDKIMVCTQVGNAQNRYNYWKEGTTCEAGKCKQEKSGAYCACTEGSTRCDGTNLLVCKDGMEKAEACKNGICSEAFGNVCTTERICRNGELSCLDNKIVTCTNGQYVVKEDCGGQKICSAMGNQASCRDLKGECLPTATKCLGTNVMECGMSGMQLGWNVSKKCAESKPAQICVENTNMGMTSAACAKETCKNFATQCGKNKKNMVQICINNEWHDATDCNKAGMKCDSGVCKK